MKRFIKLASSALIVAFGLGAAGTALADEISDPELIKQAEEILYNLNYDVGPVDGTIDDETRNAIRRFQSNMNLNETGELTVEILLELRSARAPTVWGALSAAVDGAWGGTWRYSTRAEAERDAKKVCRENTELSCGMTSMHSDGCVALYHWETKENWGYVMRHGNSIDKAKLETLAGCRENREANAPCTLRTVVCADGRHEKKK